MGKLTIEELERQSKEVEGLTKDWTKEDFDLAMSKLETALNNVEKEEKEGKIFESSVDEDDQKLIYEYYSKRLKEIDEEYHNKTNDD